MVFPRRLVTRSTSSIVFTQRKDTLKIVKEIRMMDYRPIDTPTDPNIKLLLGQGNSPGDLERVV